MAKSIRSISMEIRFDCGGSVSAVLDYRMIKPDNAVLANSTSTILDFMMNSSGSNIRDQLPLIIEPKNEKPKNEEKPPVKEDNPNESEEGINSFKNFSPNIFDDRLNWINLKKKSFMKLIMENFDMVKNADATLFFEIDKKFKTFFNSSLVNILKTPSPLDCIKDMYQAFNLLQKNPEEA